MASHQSCLHDTAFGLMINSIKDKSLKLLKLYRLALSYTQS